MQNLQDTTHFNTQSHKSSEIKTSWILKYHANDILKSMPLWDCALLLSFPQRSQKANSILKQRKTK